MLSREFETKALFAPAIALCLVLSLSAGCGAHAPRDHASPHGEGLPAPDETAADGDEQPIRLLTRQPPTAADLAPGFAIPYPLDRIYGVFYDCRRRGRQHRGLDIGGIGPDAGLGTPIRALVRSRITFIGTPESDARQFGQRDRRGGNVERRGRQLPRSAEIPAYGTVYFFTRDYGSWHAGVTLIMEALDTEIQGHQIRYMHLAAIHPELRVGDIVEAGQEVGLMGGTAVMHDLPHIHIDIEDERGRRIDVAPLLGLPADTPRSCR